MTGKKSVLENLTNIHNIFEGDEALGSYSKDLSFAHPMQPRYIIKPENTEELQEIIKWANQTKTPLVPVSSGPPHFRGDTVPSVPEAIIVDLRAMNNIIKIDRRNRFAFIEPGVTYPKLQLELAKEGLTVSKPLLPRANKSALSSMLEREPNLIPKYQWSLLYPLRCLEVIWGDGQRMTTGNAKSMGTLEEEWEMGLAQVSEKGPGQTDFYQLVSAAQGSMGIVTLASIKCEILPEIHKLFFVASQRLESLVDFTYKILRFRYGDEILILNNSNLASILGENIEQVEALINDLPPFIVVIGIAGRDRLPYKRIEFQEKDISDIAQQFGLKLLSAIPGIETDSISEVIFNTSREPYWKLGYKGASQDIFFLTTLDRIPTFKETIYSIAKAHNYPSSDIGIYIQPIQQGTSCHCEFVLPYNKDNPGEVSKTHELYVHASEELLKQGAYYSRPYGIWADMAYNRDAQTRNILKKIKGIFDPNNVMNPGKLCF